MSSPWARFFPPGYLHNGYRGMDLYHVPQGARSLLLGHWISGETLDHSLSFTEGEYTNRNVYHPATPLTVGAVLQLFSKDTAEVVWHLTKLVTTLEAILYLLRRYRESRFYLLSVGAHYVWVC